MPTDTERLDWPESAGGIFTWPHEEVGLREAIDVAMAEDEAPVDSQAASEEATAQEVVDLMRALRASLAQGRHE